jgi:hypothetical protein
MLFCEFKLKLSIFISLYNDAAAAAVVAAAAGAATIKEELFFRISELSFSRMKLVRLFL